MATALPVITTQVGGNAALLEDGSHGILVPSEDAPALAAELLKQYRLRADSDHQAARESIIRRYGLQAMLARYAKGLFKLRYSLKNILYRCFFSICSL